MPLLLTAAFSPGDLDPGKSYTHVKVLSFSMSIAHSVIEVTVERGYLDDGAWVKGEKAPTQRFVIKDDDYTTLVASLPEDDTTPLYTQVANVIYNWLTTNGHFAGTIV